VVDDEQGRWLTYPEAGKMLGISAEAARQLARRRKWPRRTPNEYGAMATVLVPDDPPVRARPGVIRDTTGVQMPEANGDDRPDESPAVRGLNALLAEREATIHDLRSRLDAAGEERQQLSDERRELLTALADARTAAMISSSDAAVLRIQLDLLTNRRPWWRGWFR
jgi:hypothetical protein